MTRVEFNLETVKKIQNGEIKGTIRTRDGRKARFLGEINDPVYPLVFVKQIKYSEKELLATYTATGKYSAIHDELENDIIIEIEDEHKKSEYQLKPFDKVLVRNSTEQMWHPNFYATTDGLLFYTTDCKNWSMCIPYEGNEHLIK